MLLVTPQEASPFDMLLCVIAEVSKIASVLAIQQPLAVQRSTRKLSSDVLMMYIFLSVDQFVGAKGIRDSNAASKT